MRRQTSADEGPAIPARKQDETRVSLKVSIPSGTGGQRILLVDVEADVRRGVRAVLQAAG
jgi:hypothetical protein